MIKGKNKYPHRVTGEPGKPPFYIKLKKTYNKGWIGQWDLVKMRRQTNEPSIKGGNYREI